MKYNQDVEACVADIVRVANGSARLLGNEQTWKCEASLLSMRGERIMLEVWSDPSDPRINVKLSSFQGVLYSSKVDKKSDLDTVKKRVLTRMGYSYAGGKSR